MKQIPYARQHISEEDSRAVLEVLHSDWLTQGPAIERFERAVADYCGVKYAVAVSNGTAALHLACLALELGEGDIYWTSPNTFAATANCALYCRANIDFVDIDPKSYNISVAAMEEKLVQAEKHGKLPKVVAPVHFSGQSCEMARIKALSEQYGFSILEDACHAIGSEYQGKKVGSCEFSDAAVFSFHPAKIITTGEGGMVVTNEVKLFEKLMRYRNHGIVRKQKKVTDKFSPWFYELVDLGHNYRITDIQVALGISQLGRLDQFVERRREVAKNYSRALDELPVIVPWQHPDSESSYHLYVICLDSSEVSRSREQILDTLRKNGIGAHVHYIPVHTHPYYQKLGFKYGDFPSSEKYYQTAISLPMFYGLTTEDQDRVIDNLRNAFS